MGTYQTALFPEMGVFLTCIAELQINECSSFSFVCFFLADILPLGRALEVKLYLAQKMQISPKIPHGSNDELGLNIKTNTKQANLSDI